MPSFLFLSFFVCLLVVTTIADDSSTTVELYRRCGGCNSGNCRAQSFNIGVCSPYCNPCTDTCFGSYLLTKQDDNDFYIKTYDNNNCTSEYDIAVHVYCDSCFYYENTELCPAFYLRCTSYWWLWTLCILLVALIGCLTVAGVAAFLRRRQIEAIFADGNKVDYVSYEQAVHQSQSGYQGYQSGYQVNSSE